MKKLSPKGLTGTSGDDVLIGTGEAETIEGLEGNDTLIGNGSPGAPFTGPWDTLIGGPGNDIYRAEYGQVTIIEQAGEGFDAVYAIRNYTLGKGQEIELLSYIEPSAIPTGGGVTLIGNAFSQTIIGSAGNDTLVGDGGGDVMAGGGGNDTYRVVHAGDVILEYAGGGYDRAFLADGLTTYTLQAGYEIESLGPLGSSFGEVFTLTGNEFHNFLSGASGVDTLIGGGGDDLLQGLQGGDIYRIDDPGDAIMEVVGSSGTDQAYVAMTLSGYVLNDDTPVEVLAAIDASSTATFDLTGNKFANTIFGSAGSNTLIGGGGNDTLVGYGGNDFYRADDSGDIILESAGGGFDSVYAAASYTLTAGQAIEVLRAIDPAATAALDLTGNAGANELYGNAGANRLDGKTGTDLLFGGGGADIFAFTTSYDGGDVDRILDFAAGTDKIGLGNEIFPFIGAEGPLNANAFVVGTAAGDADDRVIYNAATGQLFYDYDGNGAQAAVLFATLAGAPTLTASDFLVI